MFHFVAMPPVSNWYCNPDGKATMKPRASASSRHADWVWNRSPDCPVPWYMTTSGTSFPATTSGWLGTYTT